MSEPRTAREALIAQMLGELDDLLARAEQIPKSIAEAEARIALSARLLDKAGDQYRLAVTAFTDEAKATLTEHLEHKASQLVALTVQEQRAALQEVARAALQVEATYRTAQLTTGPCISSGRYQHALSGRLLEHGVTAILASVLTATLVLTIVHIT